MRKLVNQLKLFVVVLLLAGGVCCQGALANTVHDVNKEITLSRIVNQLDAILPLIDEAEAAQAREPLSATRFRFESRITPDGVVYTGLREDILSMRQALINAIEHKPLALAQIRPVSKDYIDVPSLAGDTHQNTKSAG